MIHFQHVTKTYKGSWKALDDVTLQIAKGEFVFLTGPSGAGKSTLLKMIYMDERPDALRGGQVLVCVYGRGWYQEWGKEARELHPGDVVSIPPDVKHWHGATADSWFQHLAIEVPGEGSSNEWLEPVDDEQYVKLEGRE